MLVLKVKYNNVWTDLDLYGDESINFNKSVLEVQEFDKISSDFTKAFRIPGTENNNKIMGHIFKINIQESTFDPKESLECAITFTGNVLLVGSLRLEKMYVNVQQTDYEVVVYSQLGSLASSISEYTLCDLDFSEYTHPLTYNNISSSWNLNLFDGDIVYPFIHYGYDDEDIIPDIEFTNTQYSFDSPENALPFWYYKPSIRVNKVIEKIINYAGYELKSDFMSSEEFDDIYMPLSFSSELGVQTIEDISFYASISTNDAIDVGSHNVIFDIEISDTSNSYDNLTGLYTFTKEGRYSFKVDYSITTIDCCEYDGDPYYHLYDRWVRDRGGNETYFDERFLGYPCNVVNEPYLKTITIDVGSSGSSSDWRVGDKIAFGTLKEVKDCNSYTITSSDNNHSDIEYYACEDDTTPITLRVYAGSPETICANPDIPPVFIQHSGTIVDNGPCPSIHTCDATIDFLSTFLLYDTPAEPGDGSDVVVEENLSCDTTMLDFLKGIFTHYNMVVVPDADDPVKLIIEPFVNWINDTDVVRDWTDYLDTTKDVVVQPLVDNDNRFVKFFDAEDSDKLNKFNQDNYNQIFGELTFDSESKIVSNTKEIETIFSPTPSETLDGSGSMIVPKLYEEDDAGNKRVFSTNPRLLYYNGMLNVNDTYYVRDENDVVYPLTQYPCMSLAQQLDTPTPDRNVKTLTWQKVYNYYSQLSGDNTTNAEGSYYNLFWKDYFVDIYDSDSRIITAYFNIPFQEFSQIQLNDKIQISGLFGNTRWRINRIIDYDLKDPGMTKVELIKSIQVPEPVYIKRTYLLEKCDELQQTVATYYSLKPLEPNSSVWVEGFTDCYFVVEQTDLEPLTEITRLWDDCVECGFGDTGNIYVLEDMGRQIIAYDGNPNIDDFDGLNTWYVGEETGTLDITLKKTGTTSVSELPNSPTLQLEVEFGGFTFRTPQGVLGGLDRFDSYTFTINKINSTDYIKTRFVDDVSDLSAAFQVIVHPVNSSTPQRIEGQSLTIPLQNEDIVWLGPDIVEHSLKMWRVIGKNSQATGYVQITEPFGNGRVQGINMIVNSEHSFITYGQPATIYEDSFLFQFGKIFLFSNSGGTWQETQPANYSIEIQGVGVDTSTPYTFYSQYNDTGFDDKIAGYPNNLRLYPNNPNSMFFSVDDVVKIVDVSENVRITNIVGIDTVNNPKRTDVLKIISK